MRRWKSGLLYFSLKSVNPTNQPSLTFGQPSSPKLHSTSGLSSIKHQKDTKMSPVWQFLEGVTSAEPNQCFPWLNKDNWEQPPKCGGISAGWIPAAPDCACSFRRAPWWAVAAVVLSPNPWVWNMHVTAVCQVCPEALVPAPESVLVCSRTVCFSCSCGRICLFDSFTCTCYFLHTLPTLACGILSPKMCLHFFFQVYQLFSLAVLPKSGCFACVSFDRNSVTQTSVMLLFDHNFSNNRALLTSASS